MLCDGNLMILRAHWLSPAADLPSCSCRASCPALPHHDLLTVEAISRGLRRWVNYTFLRLIEPRNVRVQGGGVLGRQGRAAVRRRVAAQVHRVPGLGLQRGAPPRHDCNKCC